MNGWRHPIQGARAAGWRGTTTITMGLEWVPCFTCCGLGLIFLRRPHGYLGYQCPDCGGARLRLMEVTG